MNWTEQDEGKTRVYACASEKGSMEVPCQACGRLVVVPKGFSGCVFCGECRMDGGYTYREQY